MLPILNRTCVKDYQIPGTNKFIEKDTEIYIPVLALQMDEKFYENPTEFQPDRFSEENLVGKNQINQIYMPFGDGPRNCIGMRLGKMQTKVGLVMMLQKFTYHLNDELRAREMKFDPKHFLLAPLGDIHLHVSKR